MAARGGRRSASGPRRPSRRLRRGRHVSPLLEPVEPPARSHRHTEDGDEHHHRQSGGRAERVDATVEGRAIEEQTQDVGRADGAAVDAAHGPDQAEDVERVDEHEHGHRPEDRRQQRERDVPERLPGAGAVDLGGLGVVLRDSREASREQQHREAQVVPGVDHDDHGEGRGRIAQPGQGQVIEPQVLEHGVHRSEGGVQDERPDVAHHQRADHVRQHVDHAQEPAATARLLEQDREEQRQRRR